MIRLKLAGKILDIDMPDKLLHSNFDDFRSDENGDADIVFGADVIGVDLLKEENISGDRLDTVKAEIADNISKAFFEKVTQMGMFVLRSAAVTVGGVAYLFASPAGEGKTTHAGNWIKYFDAKQFAGDVTILELIKNDDGKEELFAYGYPWGRSADKADNARVKVASICFVRKHFENEIRQAMVQVASDSLMKNIYEPELAKKYQDDLKSFSIRAAKTVAMFVYGCVDNKASAKLSYRFMTGVYVRG